VCDEPDLRALISDLESGFAMTPQQRHDLRRHTWIDLGQMIAGGTLVVICIGAIVHAQAIYVPSERDIVQAATNATMSTKLDSLDKRVSGIEGKLDYALMAAAGILGTQILSLGLQRKAGK
jgi:hypothetical protein